MRKAEMPMGRFEIHPLSRHGDGGAVVAEVVPAAALWHRAAAGTVPVSARAVRTLYSARQSCRIDLRNKAFGSLIAHFFLKHRNEVAFPNLFITVPNIYLLS